MKVILSKDIPSLGEEGDIKVVARGYARNYLIPQKLVMPYTPESLAILESRRESIEQRRAEKSKAAMDVKERLESESLVIRMPAGERGRLFGSVTSATVIEALAARGITVERKRVEIPGKTIKSVGTTRVRVRLYGDEEAELKIVVEGTSSTGGETDAGARAESTAGDAKEPAEAKSAAEDDVEADTAADVQVAEEEAARKKAD